MCVCLRAVARLQGAGANVAVLRYDLPSWQLARRLSSINGVLLVGDHQHIVRHGGSTRSSWAEAAMQVWNFARSSHERRPEWNQGRGVAIAKQHVDVARRGNREARCPGRPVCSLRCAGARAGAGLPILGCVARSRRPPGFDPFCPELGGQDLSCPVRICMLVLPHVFQGASGRIGGHDTPQHDQQHRLRMSPRQPLARWT